MPTVREASALLRAQPSGGKAADSNPERVNGPDESRGAIGQKKDFAGSGRGSVLQVSEPPLQLPTGDDESDASLRVYCEDSSGKRTHATLRVRPRARFAAAPRCVSIRRLLWAVESTNWGCQICKSTGKSRMLTVGSERVSKARVHQQKRD